MEERRRVGVYCGSRTGDDPAFVESARAVGRGLGRRGADMVFGGGRSGLMGEVADAALAAGSHVVGVIPTLLADREIAHHGVSDLRLVTDMTERKRAMYDLADAFLALPGGVGTMEELFEVLSWGSLGLHPKPIGLLNVSGYYDLLLGFVDASVVHGLCKPAVRALLWDDDDPERLLDRLLRVPV